MYHTKTLINKLFHTLGPNKSTSVVVSDDNRIVSHKLVWRRYHRVSTEEFLVAIKWKWTSGYRLTLNPSFLTYCVNLNNISVFGMGLL